MEVVMTSKKLKKAILETPVQKQTKPQSSWQENMDSSMAVQKEKQS
jgi:hypothetical protein